MDNENALEDDLRRLGLGELPMYRGEGWDELVEAPRGLPESLESGPTLIEKIANYELDPNDKLAIVTLRHMKARLRKKTTKRKTDKRILKRKAREADRKRRRKKIEAKGSDMWNALEGVRMYHFRRDVQISFEEWMALCEYAERKYGVNLWENPRMVALRTVPDKSPVISLDTISWVRYRLKNLFRIEDFKLWYHGYCPLD
jgi:hypothetical protein